MTQADPLPSALRVRIRRGKLLALGVGLTLFCVMLLAFGSFGFSRTGGVHFLSVLCAAMVLLFGTAALYLLGMAIKNPIALRMDHHGISGFYTAPARWSDIKKVAVTTGSKNEKYLSLALKDPIAFRNHQTPFQRFTSWQNGAATGYHITIPQSVLLDVTVETLAEHAHAFHQSTHADVT